MVQFLVEMGLVLVLPVLLILILGALGPPWWARRYGRKGYGPRLVQMQSDIGGEWPYRKCECGKDVDKKTNQHVELVTMSLQEAMKYYGPKCPDKDKKND